jgi:hypothetical protein
VLETNVLFSTIQTVIEWHCHHSKSQFPNNYKTSCQPEILNHLQKPTNHMFWPLPIIILTRASRYSTLLSNVVSFSFSTASRERHDMSVIKQTEITSWVTSIWVINYYLNRFKNRSHVPGCSYCFAIVPNGDRTQTLPDLTIVKFRRASTSQILYLELSIHVPPSIKSLTDNIKQFKSALKNYLHAHSFCSVDEYVNVNRDH